MNNNNKVANIYGDNQMKPVNAAGTQIATSRQAQEVQAAMVVAKQFPRNESDACNRIITACQRPTLAANAVYEYKRGTSMVTGPSIRLAEALAQSWGNIDFGFIELEQAHGNSTVMAYAWDLETNTRQSKIFTVPHIRHTKKGDYPLTDPRDIYEMIANQSSRRVRACILGLIPGDVVDTALDQCSITLENEAKGEDLTGRIAAMCNAFEENWNVNTKMLEAFIGCNKEAFSAQAIVRLRGVFQSLRDGMSKPEDYFDMSLAPKKELPKKEEPQKPDQQETPAQGEEKQVSLDEL